MNFAKALLTALLITSSLETRADIFGKDDRYDVTDHFSKGELARSVAVGVINSLWTDLGNGLSELWVDPMSEILCKDERFYSQASVSYACTGFLVGPDLLVTAGHCGTNKGEIRNSSENYCEAYTWLFDYRANSDINRIDNNNIYRCKEIVYAVLDEENKARDFALIRLDREVVGRTPLKLSENEVKKGDAVTMIGHPMGLPLKYTNNASIFDPNAGLSFFTNLDAFSGNSGSPVFNNQNEVIGVLVAGNPGLSTYKDPKLRCERYNRCDDQGKNCTSLPSHNQLDGFPNTFSEVQGITHYLEIINQAL